jgi:guanylate kinase
MNTNKIIIFCAPSGSGKTTIARKMLDSFSVLYPSISATNRPPRANEVDGVDYHFVSTQEFKDKIDKGEFVECEEVYGNRFYGTLKSEISIIQGLGKIPLFDIDVKGAMNLKKVYGDLALVFFIKVPVDILKERLLSRNTETQETLDIRMNRVNEEMKFENLADKVVLNINLEDAVSECRKIISDFLGIK